MTPEELIKSHDKRLKRAGEKLWTEVLTILNGTKIMSGMMAMKIRDTYGLRAQDIVFLCATHNVEINLDEFCDLLNEEQPKRPSIQCCGI